MTACSVWSWVLLSYRLQFSVRRIGCHGIQFRWRHSFFHDFFILIPLLLVINSCSPKIQIYKLYTGLEQRYLLLFSTTAQRYINQGLQLESNWKPREEGRGKRKPCPPPPLFWHINLTSVSPLESFLTLPNSLGFNFLTVIVRTAKYVKYVCFEG